MRVSFVPGEGLPTFAAELSFPPRVGELVYIEHPQVSDTRWRVCDVCWPFTLSDGRPPPGSAGAVEIQAAAVVVQLCQDHGSD